jgi:hypothetical protein
MSETDDLHQRQLRREEGAVDEAVARYRGSLTKQLPHSRAAFAMVKNFWEPLAKRIADEQLVLAVREKSPPKYGKFMLAIDAESLAVITLHSIIGSHRWRAVDTNDGQDDDDQKDQGDLQTGDEGEAPEDPEIVAEDPDTMQAGAETAQPGEPDAEGATLASVARELERQCEYHWMTSAGAKRETGIERCISGYIPETKKREEKRIRASLNGAWRPGGGALRLGLRLLELAENAGIVKIGMGKPYHRRRKAKIVTFNRTFERLFVEASQHYENFTPPFRRPMIVPPVKWGVGSHGGYCCKHEHVDLPLIKTNDAAGSVDGLLGTNWTTTFEAINALQETRWKINDEIFDAMQRVRNMMFAGELTDLVEAQIKPLGLLVTSKAPKKSKNAEREPVRYVIDDKCDVCRDIKDTAEIFFPYQVDYRGRAYPVSAGVNPQVDDVGRALLQFATGKPLNKVGARWLAVHLANSWGRDVTLKPKPGDMGKVAYRVRVNWVRTNAKRIKECAVDPFGSRWWMKAAKPWRFLAACFEWNRYRSNPRYFTTHLPVTIDGTCNGLQHIAALRLNSHLATETNLAPSEEPHDIYRTIADQLKGVLEREKQAGEEKAIQWLKHVEIDRDVCKSAVMTTPYGVTQTGMAGQLFEEDFSAALHIPGHGPFFVEHMRNYDRFEQRLLNKSDGVSEFVWNRLSGHVQQTLKSLDFTAKERCKLVVLQLNAIVERESIYDPSIFTNLSDETNELLKTNPDGDAVARLNKLLLLDSYPLEIKKTQGHRWWCCWYLAGKLEECIRQAVDPDDDLKKWLQEVATGRAKRNEGTSWVSPSGFPVAQRALIMQPHEIEVGRCKININKPKGKRTNGFKVSVQSQKNKIAPNFIHSLDAAHLMRTVRSLKSKGVDDFGVIHDGYVVHACHVDQLQSTLREEFVQMYSKDLLQDFCSQQNFAGFLVPTAPPKPGDFDIRKVIESEYFFC